MSGSDCAIGTASGWGRWKHCRDGLGRGVRLGLGRAGVAGLYQTAGQCWCGAARLWCGRAAPSSPAASSPAVATNAAVPVLRGTLLAWSTVGAVSRALLRTAGLVGFTWLCGGGCLGRLSTTWSGSWCRSGAGLAGQEEELLSPAVPLSGGEALRTCPRSVTHPVSARHHPRFPVAARRGVWGTRAGAEDGWELDGRRGGEGDGGAPVRVPPRRATAAAAGRAARREGEGLPPRKARVGKNGNACGDPLRAAWPARTRDAGPEGLPSHHKEKEEGGGGGQNNSTKNEERGSGWRVIEPKKKAEGRGGRTKKKKQTKGRTWMRLPEYATPPR